MMHFSQNLSTISIRTGDDADYGWDSTNDDDTDGHAGLSYTKLDINGDDLPPTAVSWEFVRDNRTELTYRMNVGTANWATAQADAAAYTALGKIWRVPTIKELVYLADLSKDNDVFDPMIGYVENVGLPWSSTENVQNTTQAWAFDKDVGLTVSANGKTNQYDVMFCSGTELIASLVDNGDDTVTDLNTGFMWTKYFLGGDSVTPPVAKNWNTAIDDCLACAVGGYSDWRLPNIKELQTLLKYDHVDPPIDQTFFPTIPADTKVWSSTDCQMIPGNAWMIFLQDTGFQIWGSKTVTNDQYALAMRNTNAP